MKGRKRGRRRRSEHFSFKLHPQINKPFFKTIILKIKFILISHTFNVCFLFIKFTKTSELYT